MTHRLTVRAFPDGEVWFFEKEMWEQYESQIQRLRTKCLQTKKSKYFRDMPDFNIFVKT